MYESDSQANIVNDARRAAYNGGQLRFYTGTRPANVAAGVTGTLLASPTFSNPAFGSSASRVMTANAITSANGVASGTIGYGAAFTSGGTLISTHSVTVTGGGGEIQVNSLTVTAGVAVSVSSCTIEQPDGD